MAKYEVTTDLVIHTRVKVIIEADSAAEAIDGAADVLPSNHDRGASGTWKAKVELKVPRGVTVTSCKAYHFEQGSGADKARKV